MHTSPYVSCFPLWSGVELTTGIPWQSGQKLFSFLEYLFPGCAFAFFLFFLCPCSPCITMSRYVVQTEGLPGYQLCRISLLDTNSFQRCFKVLSFYCLHATSMTAAASGALSGNWECAHLWRANLPSSTGCETKVREKWSDMYPWLDSCSSGGQLAQSFWLGPTTVPVFSHIGNIFATFTFVFSFSIVYMPSEEQLQLGWQA